jgi:hypothetical protein
MMYVGPELHSGPAASSTDTVNMVLKFDILRV